MPEHFKFLCSFIFPVAVSIFLYTGPHSITDALLWTFSLWFMVLADGLSPDLATGKEEKQANKSFYDLLLYGLGLIQFLNMFLLFSYASQLSWQNTDEIITTIVNLIVLRILVGTSSGSSAIIVAHEWIHRNNKLQRLLGRFLLYTVCYPHFIISHLHGHHQHVASLEDIMTARLDERFNHYWKRVIQAEFKFAWNFERQRLGINKQNQAVLNTVYNKVFQGLCVQGLILSLILISFGWLAVFIFLYQSLAAVRLLQTINYFQHWGLEQGRSNNVLAWANNSAFSYYALIALPNHIAHHQYAGTPFYQNRYSEKGPVMPAGYFVSNLWVKWFNGNYCRIAQSRLKSLKSE